MHTRVCLLTQTTHSCACSSSRTHTHTHTHAHAHAHAHTVGDLMLTAFGSLSRNRTCGARLVAGEKLQDITQTMTVEVSVIRLSSATTTTFEFDTPIQLPGCSNLGSCSPFREAMWYVG